MNRTTRVTLTALASSAVLVGLPTLAATPAHAASPAPTASCAAALSQGGTPHGVSQSDPGFLGSFVSGLARSGPGTVGTTLSTVAVVHGDLGTCFATLGLSC